MLELLRLPDQFPQLRGAIGLTDVRREADNPSANQLGRGIHDRSGFPGEPAIADAVLDRLPHDEHTIELSKIRQIQ